jgi:hypothetical protein
MISGVSMLAGSLLSQPAGEWKNEEINFVSKHLFPMRGWLSS